ncbi:MCE family protein [bacterium]|nr:MCE family protein [bacterium]
MEKNERKKRTSDLRKVELIVWICILIILGIIGFFIITCHENSFEAHSIYMPDVDGLIVGSPVCMMGIQVGYVTKTKIINDDEIKVRFKITNKEIRVPRGTVATVEFSGLGGSKSLQLYPPTDDKKVTEELLMSNTDFIKVERPKRLRDVSALLYEMYKTLMNIIYTATIFNKEMNKNVDINLPAKGASNMKEFLEYSDNYMNLYETNMNKIRDSIYKFNGGKYDWRKYNGAK